MKTKISLSKIQQLHDTYFDQRCRHQNARSVVGTLKHKCAHLSALAGIDWEAVEAEYMAAYPMPRSWEEEVEELTGHRPALVLSKYFEAFDYDHSKPDWKQSWQDELAEWKESLRIINAFRDGQTPLFWKGQRVVKLWESMIEKGFYTLPTEVIED